MNNTLPPNIEKLNKLTLIDLHQLLTENARMLMVKKNHDYSLGDDPYNNFRGSTLFHVEPEIGICLRMTDKMKRIETFLTSNNLKVEDETVLDCILDLINYSVLMGGMLVERLKENNSNEI